MIRNYFMICFKSGRFTNSARIIRKYKAYILRRVFLSKAIVKHTSSKVMINFFSYNLHKNYLFYNQFRRLNVIVNNKIVLYCLRFLKLNLLKKVYISSNYKDIKISYCIMKKELVLFKYNLLYNIIKSLKLYLKIYFFILKTNKANKIKRLYFNKLKFKFRKLQYKYYIYKYKFEKTKMLPYLTNYLNKVYLKKIEYNIINLKSIVYSPDMFTKALALRLKKFKIKRSITSNIFNIINKTSLRKIKAKIIIKPLEKKIKAKFFYNDSISSYISKMNFNQLLDSLNENFYRNIYLNIFNQIKFKKLGGIMIQAKGRLTNRYRADRSIFKKKIRGGLNNIDESFNKLTIVKHRGYINSNIKYSKSTQRRRIGAFTVKGWINVR